MKYLRKYHRVIYPLLIVLFLLILDKGFHLELTWLRFALAIGFAYFLAPRKKIVQTKEGERYNCIGYFLKSQ
ncbi:hypothetical protein BSU00_06905 [Tenacibaculum sp. SG-28]|nr:hypothetical protein BSU00_06905 [Tenacibaculum sp. SG-28]